MDMTDLEWHWDNYKGIRPLSRVISRIHDDLAYDGYEDDNTTELDRAFISQIRAIIAYCTMKYNEVGKSYDQKFEDLWDGADFDASATSSDIYEDAEWSVLDYVEDIYLGTYDLPGNPRDLQGIGEKEAFIAYCITVKLPQYFQK